jgi:hypothetical protein
MPKTPVATLDPAHTVIRICGGADVVAEAAGVTTVAVWKWQAPKSHGGRGGLVPSIRQARLLAWARARGIDLRPEHFCEPASRRSA